MSFLANPVRMGENSRTAQYDFCKICPHTGEYEYKNENYSIEMHMLSNFGRKRERVIDGRYRVAKRAEQKHQLFAAQHPYTLLQLLITMADKVCTNFRCARIDSFTFRYRRLPPPLPLLLTPQMLLMRLWVC